MGSQLMGNHYRILLLSYRVAMEMLLVMMTIVVLVIIHF